jgi:plastocyanin
VRSKSRKQPAANSPTLRRIAVLGFLLLGAGELLAQTEGRNTGRIEGTVLLSPDVIGRRRAVRPYAIRGPSAQPARSTRDLNELEHVVVYIERISSAAPGAGRTAAPAPVIQSQESFFPHVLPIVAGSTVEFPNGDPFFHNVFSLSRARSFDLGRYPQGASKSIRFDRPGAVQVFCHIHANMSAVILVLENAFFSRADSAGRFAIGNVPPGRYRVVAWHERIHPVTQTVDVTAGTISRIDYRIPLPPDSSE